MTKPNRYLTRMVVFLLIVTVAVGFLFPPLRLAFMANAVLNGVILGALLIGIIHTFRNVTMLSREVEWLDDFQREDIIAESASTPRLLAPMATMLGEHKPERLNLSTIAMRSLLDGIATRLDESREISRYMIGLLVFLGLLGTFWGLLGTVDSISDVIGGLTAGSAASTAFEELKSGLKAPLAGMGTAFSSSLFGLAGSLVLGFLALQAGQAQNRFYNDLEEWLSGQTKLGRGGIGGEGDQPIPAYIQALLEQTADGLENLQRTIARNEDSRGEDNRRMLELSEAIASLGDTIRTEQNLMLKLAEGQMELKPALIRLSEMGGGGVAPHPEHYRTLEALVGRIAEELANGRIETVQEIRSEIRLLARTIAALAEEAEP